MSLPSAGADPGQELVEKQLARALDCPIDQGGLALAVRHACRCLAAAASTTPSLPALQAWHQAAVAMNTRLKARSAEHPLLLTSSAQMVALPGYGTWLAPPAANPSDPRVQRVLAAQGHALAAFACTGNVVPPGLLKGLGLALKQLSGRSRQQNWAEIAQNFPTCAAEVRFWNGKPAAPAVRRTLAALDLAWSIALVPPAALTEERAPAGAASSQMDGRSDASSEDGPVDVQADFEEEASVTTNLLGWLVQRANFAGMRSHFGSDGRWDALTPAELKHVCKAIRRELLARSETSRYALLAVVSLCSSLPARLAMSLAFRPSGNIWIASGFESLRWSLQALLEGGKSTATAVDLLLPDRIVDIALPRDAIEFGAELMRSNSSAEDLAVLLTGSADALAHRQFKEAYRAWLRGLGPGWAHAVYDARFAASLSQMHRARYGDVAAAWLSLDFREASLGMMHYICLPKFKLNQWASAVLADVGLSDAVAGIPTGYVGSAIALDADAFAAGWRSLQVACDSYRASLATCADLVAAARSATALSISRLAGVVIAMAGRGDLLGRLTWNALYAQADVVLLVDKRVDSYSDLRGIPVHALLREQLDAHLEDLHLLAAACRRLGQPSTDRRGRDLTRPQGQGAAFCGLQAIDHRGAASLQRTAISTGDIDVVAQHHFGRPINVGRHTLLSLAASEGWDPWWAKVLSGHHRGHAEPFSDGGVVAPAHALAQLRDALDLTLGHLASERYRSTSDRKVLDLNQLHAPRSMPSRAPQRLPGSKARLLPPAWQPATLCALRICDHLRLHLAMGQGPSQAGAEALLAGLLVNAIRIEDLRLIWTDQQAFHSLGGRGAAVLWRRNSGGRVQQRLVSPLWAVSLLRAGAGKSRLPAWSASSEQAARWLRMVLPEFGWPDDDVRCLRTLEHLFQMWLRFHLSPFVLSAEHPALAAAVPNRLSLLRLAMDEPVIAADDDVLILQAHAPRAGVRAPLKESPFKQVVKQVHRFGRTDLQLGEDEQRWQDLAQKLIEMECDGDARAEALRQVVLLDRDRWLGRHKARVEVSSFSTYLYRISDDLERIAPNEDLLAWQEEWVDWFDSVETSTLSGDSDKRAALVNERYVAVRHLLRALFELKYPVPAALLVTEGRPTSESNHRPASATVLLQSDRRRVNDLLKRHFAEDPMVCELADLYCALVFAASLRSAEIGALPLNAVTPFGDLAVDSDGFSHLKSEHARRLQHLPDVVVTAFREAAALVQAAEPGARWLFLLRDPNNWHTSTTVARAFGAALRQVTGDADARQHATRPMAPLAQLLPGWEDLFRQLVRGQASTQQCLAFLASVQEQGVGRLVQVLQVAGHGHPLTFLTHYFAVWPWVLACFVQSSHAGLGDAAALLRNRMPEVYAGFRKARQRAHEAKEVFDAWGWVGRRAIASLNWPPLQAKRMTAPTAEPLPATDHIPTPGRAAQALYLAGRFMGMAPAAAAHAFGLSNTVAASAEAHFDEHAVAALRHRRQGEADGRGRSAEMKLLRGEDGATLAARLLMAPFDDLRRLVEGLSVQRAGPHTRTPMESLIARLRATVALLPLRYGLYVQTGQGRYGAEELARIPASSAQLFLGPADRDLGNRPRLSVVDFASPENRVRRARLTSLVRCVARAALAIRQTDGRPS